MILRILQYIRDIWRGVSFGGLRSNQWPRVRKDFLKKYPNCAVCGTDKKQNIHHISPFHLKPELELDKKNLITLCGKNNCHLRFGHLYSFKSYNSDIETDAKLWNKKIINRPKVV